MPATFRIVKINDDDPVTPCNMSGTQLKVEGEFAHEFTPPPPETVYIRCLFFPIPSNPAVWTRSDSPHDHDASESTWVRTFNGSPTGGQPGALVAQLFYSPPPADAVGTPERTDTAYVCISAMRSTGKATY